MLDQIIPTHQVLGDGRRVIRFDQDEAPARSGLVPAAEQLYARRRGSAVLLEPIERGRVIGRRDVPRDHVLGNDDISCLAVSPLGSRSF